MKSEVQSVALELESCGVALILSFVRLTEKIIRFEAEPPLIYHIYNVCYLLN